MIAQKWIQVVRKMKKRIRRIVNANKSTRILANENGVLAGTKEYEDTEETYDEAEAERIARAMQLGLLKRQKVLFNPDKFIYNPLAFRLKFGKDFDKIVNYQVKRLQDGMSHRSRCQARRQNLSGVSLTVF